MSSSSMLSSKQAVDVKELARKYRVGYLGGQDIIEKLTSAKEPRKAIIEFQQVKREYAI